MPERNGNHRAQREPESLPERGSRRQFLALRLAHRRLRVLGFVVLAVATPGCVTNAPLPSPSSSGSIIAFVRNLEQRTSTLLDKVVVSLPNPADDHGSYVSWQTNWCPRHEQVHTRLDVLREVSSFCAGQGGTYRGDFCVNARNSNIVLFYAHVLAIGTCQYVTWPAGVQILQPKPGLENAPGYLAALHQVGYRTAAEARQERVAREQQVKEQQRLLALQLPLLRKRGTRICKTLPNVMYVGFVDDVSDEKIRISVEEAYRTDVLTLPGVEVPVQNFKPTTIWDYPVNWRVCEFPH